MRGFALWLGLGLIAGTGAEAAARPLEKELPVGQSICYERIYPPAHLAAHPKQQVTRIKLEHGSQPGEEGAETLSATVEVWAKGREGSFALTGTCSADGQGLRCAPEWEAGAFRIDPAKDGMLRVTNEDMVFNPAGFSSAEESADAIRLEGDDRTWLLPAKAGCTAPPPLPVVPNPPG